MPCRTLVAFHARPDGEAMAPVGTMAEAASEGHRVVLAFATRGEHGEVEDGFAVAVAFGEDDYVLCAAPPGHPGDRPLRVAGPTG